jgi:hypothetical protein
MAASELRQTLHAGRLSPDTNVVPHPLMSHQLQGSQTHSIVS